jgi:hypothetical protein
MKDTFQKPRTRFRTVLIVVAPSAILFIGVSLICVSAIVLSGNPFNPNPIVMFGGTAVIVTVVLVAILSIGRHRAEGPDSGDPPAVEP